METYAELSASATIYLVGKSLLVVFFASLGLLLIEHLEIGP